MAPIPPLRRGVQSIVLPTRPTRLLSIEQERAYNVPATAHAVSQLPGFLPHLPLITALLAERSGGSDDNDQRSLDSFFQNDLTTLAPQDQMQFFVHMTRMRTGQFNDLNLRENPPNFEIPAGVPLPIQERWRQHLQFEQRLMRQEHAFSFLTLLERHRVVRELHHVGLDLPDISAIDSRFPDFILLNYTGTDENNDPLTRSVRINRRTGQADVIGSREFINRAATEEAAFLDQLPPEIQDQVRNVFTRNQGNSVISMTTSRQGNAFQTRLDRGAQQWLIDYDPNRTEQPLRMLRLERSGWTPLE